jgi:hypothetical protein
VNGDVTCNLSLLLQSLLMPSFSTKLLHSIYQMNNPVYIRTQILIFFSFVSTRV